MHIACEDKNILVIDSSQKHELRDFHNSNSNKPKIFHLHGRVGNTSSIIFTTEDYDKLYKSDDGFYRSSITALRDLFKYNQVVFIGYSLDDIDLLITLAQQHDLFEENTGPHYILVQRNEESKIRNKISKIPIEIIIFENFGPPLIALIDNICDEAFEEKSINLINNEFVIEDSISIKKQCSKHNNREIERIAKRKYIRELYIVRDIESTLKKLLINDESLSNQLRSITDTPYTILKGAKDAILKLNDGSDSSNTKNTKSAEIKKYNKRIEVSSKLDEKLNSILSTPSPCSGGNRKVFEEIEGLLLDIQHDSNRNERELIENSLEIVINARKFITVIVDRAGGGKTNLFCHVSIANNKSEPTIFLGGRINIDSEDALIIALAKSLGAAGECDPFDYLTGINNILENDKVNTTVFIDGINENRDINKLNLALNKLSNSMQSTRFRFVLSCRDIYWGFFKDSEWVNSSSVIRGNLYSFNPREQELALEAYLSFFKIEVNLGRLAKERCSHPLLLRFFCEAYSDPNFKKINLGNVDDIRLKPLFDDYWKAKIGGMSPDNMNKNKANVEFVVFGIIKHMINENSTFLTTDLVTEATGVDDLNSEASVYLGLLDEDIIIEEDPTNDIDIRKVVFVYEEFMEYAAARYLQQNSEKITSNVHKCFKFFNDKKENFVNALGIAEYYCAFLLEKKKYSIAFDLIVYMARTGGEWLPIISNIFSKYETSLHMIINLSTNEIVSAFDILNSESIDVDRLSDLMGLSIILRSIGSQNRSLMCEISQLLIFSSLLPSMFNLHNVIENKVPANFIVQNSLSSESNIKMAGKVIKMVAKLFDEYNLSTTRAKYWSGWAGSKTYVGLEDRTDLLKTLPSLLQGSQRKSLVLTMACNGLFDQDSNVRRACALITQDLKNEFATKIRTLCKKNETDISIRNLLKDNI